MASKVEMKASSKALLLGLIVLISASIIGMYMVEYVDINLQESYETRSEYIGKHLLIGEDTILITDLDFIGSNYYLRDGTIVDESFVNDSNTFYLDEVGKLVQ